MVSITNTESFRTILTDKSLKLVKIVEISKEFLKTQLVG